jgi:Protein of unknown function (DUF3987)/Primase C terminal 2 (PriCT-2)
MTREEVVSLRQRLLDHSFQPIGVYNWDYQNIPQKVRGKRPSEPNWQNTVGMPVYRDDALNTGVLTGTVYPLDIDVEDRTIVTEIVTMAETLFGRTIVRCRQNSARRLLPYRIENPDARKIIILLSCGKLEFLGRGQQFVGFGKHFSGAAYEWQERSLDEIEIAELPVIEAARINAFRTWTEECWPVAEKAKPNGSGRKNGGKADFRNTCFREDVEATLKQLPCDYDRETWVKLGMAHRAGGGSYAVFLAWSRQHPQYESDTYVRAQWRSFANNHSLTAATLFDEVFRRFPGWKKPSERGPDYTNPAEDDDWEGEPGDEAEDDASMFTEEALPLCPEPRPAEPYPLAALGSLQRVVEGIAEAVGCEPGLAAQSVLMTASLATVGIADIDLPKIGVTGLPLFFVTIARSSERKSSADRRAIRGVKDRVAELAKEHKLQAKRHKDEVRIYAAAENQILKDRKLDRKTKAEKLQALGPEPLPLLHPVLASADMTVEGVIKEWARKTFRAAQALTTSEGGMFVSGAAMTKDMRMRTVATLCSLWDCEMMTKVRAGDGVLIAGEKRLVVHFMIQPNFVPELLGDPVLRQQGFLSRLLIAWPRSRIGFRADEGDDDQEAAATPAEEEFRRRIHALVSRYASDELDLGKPLRVELEARKLWRAYSNEVERAQQPGAIYADLSDVAGKSAEMAGRLAGVLTLYDRPGATTVAEKVMRDAITLARWYLNEALRITETGMLRPEIVDAIELLKWLRANPQHRSRSGVLLYGPNRLRSKLSLEPILRILADHNLIVLPKRGSIHVRD